MPSIPSRVYGLGFDILGAFVIIIPDIPFIRHWHRAGRLQEAKTILETKGLSRHETSYSELLNLIYSIKPSDASDFDREPDLLRNQLTTLQASPVEHIYAYYVVNGSDEMASEQYSEISYHGLRLAIEEEINRSESRTRELGFTILALGFLIQIIGILS